jgi:hypothetical protein
VTLGSPNSRKREGIRERSLPWSAGPKGWSKIKKTTCANQHNLTGYEEKERRGIQPIHFSLVEYNLKLKVRKKYFLFQG